MFETLLNVFNNLFSNVTAKKQKKRFLIQTKFKLIGHSLPDHASHLSNDNPESLFGEELLKCEIYGFFFSKIEKYQNNILYNM